MSAQLKSLGGVLPDTCRIVVMGAACVGKTAIISQFLNHTFADGYKATIEELHRKEFHVSGQNGPRLVLEILDTSGAFQFPAMRELSISRSDAFLLVYAVDDPESFEQVRHLREQILHNRIGLMPPIVIVGNKCDVSQRRVCRETAETIACIDWEHSFLETSAKNDENIEDVFKSLLTQMDVDVTHLVLTPDEPWRRGSLPPYDTNHNCNKLRLLKRHSSCVIA